jgi:pimeloyl-ACP methyl ester carboxylesterase
MLKRFSLALVMLATAALAQDKPAAYGPMLEGFDYPFTIEHYRFMSQGAPMDMAYLNVPPLRPAPGRDTKVVVLLHGKNFCAATWGGTIAALSDAGYRVIAPDQIGFCKSTKPQDYKYTFEQLAANTHDLLKAAGVNRAIIMGHSMGGMLAVRYALTYPDETEQLVLVDPLGLEDWRAKGVPEQSYDTLYQDQLKTTDTSIRDYERSTYYAGDWKPQYETWVQMLAGLYRGAGKEIVARNSALTYQMIYSQPVVQEFPNLKMPVLLIVGDKDTSAPGKQYAPPEVRAKLGNYPVLAKEAAARIPHVKLVEYPDLGHSPQIQDPARFYRTLLDGLAGQRAD